MSMKTVLAFGLVCGLATGAVAAPAAAQDAYPSDAIRMIVPWKAGGGTDSIARALATAMEEAGGQTVLVENISGGGRVPAMLSAKDAAPDGYTMLLNGSSDISSTLVYREVPYSFDDYVCLGGVYSAPTWILSNADRGYKDISDFVAAAKAAPGELAIGVTTLNSPDEVFAKSLAEHYGVDIRIIPFNGGANLKKALLGDQVPAGVLYSPVMLGEIAGGLMNILVAGGSLQGVRYAPIRETKTLSDLGVDIEIGSYRGVIMTAGAPQDVIDAASALIETAAKSESFAAFGEKFGIAPAWISGPDYCDAIRAEMQVFRSAGE